MKSIVPAPTFQVDAARRFGGVDRLYGHGALEALATGHVVVAGLGGVGTWCAEALARSGVGALTLADMDHIAESNVNRQIHALDSTLGQAKIHAMADRIRDINPHCRLRLIDDFVSPDNVADVLSGAGMLVDCTDQVAAKVAMVVRARQQSWPIVVCGGAGGKTDPLALRAGDLALARHDALLGRVRQELRKHHGYPKGGAPGGKAHRRAPRMGVDSLWFDQPVVLPEAWRQPTPRPQLEARLEQRLHTRPPAPPPADQTLQGLSCAGYGSAVTVTATMGMAAAHFALQRLLSPGTR